MSRLPSASLAGPRRLRKTERAVEELRRIGPEGWVYVGDWPSEAFTTSISPPWENSYTNVAGRRVRFRWGIDGTFEMDGVFDLTAGAVTGDVAFTLPPEYLGWFEESFIPLELDVGVWSAAVITIDGDTGEVVLHWPIVADAIP